MMRAVLQRVRRGKVTVDGRAVAEIGPGLVILLGVGHGDSEETARALAEKTAYLRIFEDDQGKMNLSIRDIGGQALVVSQFTLYADTRRGRRPSFTDAALPDLARPLVDRFAQFLAELGVPSQTGEFGARMLVEIENDGPVTIILELS
jgi:D-aminoacyl-tRNA deacylase